MSRIVAILAGILVLALVAGGLTEGTLAYGRSGGISDDTALRPAGHSRSLLGRPAPSPKPTIVAAPSPTVATPTPALTQVVRQATTNAFVHMRASNSTSSNIVSNLDSGTVVQLLPYSDVSWQEVQYNGITGYVYKSYLNF
jgi:uncharacterized protein YgiM (DUF1202 family)